MVRAYDVGVCAAVCSVLCIGGQLQETSVQQHTDKAQQNIRNLVRVVYNQDYVTAPISDQLLFKSKDCWYVYDYQCTRQKLVNRGERDTKKAFIYARSELGKWFKFRDVPTEFVDYVASLPVITKMDANALAKDYVKRHSTNSSQYRPQTPISDSLLVSDGQFWYITNQQGDKRKITHRSDRLWNVGFSYACTEDGLWLKFDKPPEAFTSYYCNLPRAGIYSALNRLHCCQDSHVWQILGDDGLFRKITYRGKPNSLDPTIRHFCDETGRWYTVRKPPLKFVFWLLALPLRSRKVEFHCNSLLLEVDNGTSWRVKSFRGVGRKIKKRGDSWYNKRNIYTVVCDDGLFYKFKNPPTKFISYVLTLPAMHIKCLKTNISSNANTSHS